MHLSSDWSVQGSEYYVELARLYMNTKRITATNDKITKICLKLMSFFFSLSLVSEEVFSPLNSVLFLVELESDFMTSANTTTTRNTPQIGTKKKMA